MLSLEEAFHRVQKHVIEGHNKAATEFIERRIDNPPDVAEYAALGSLTVGQRRAIKYLLKVGLDIDVASYLD